MITAVCDFYKDSPPKTLLLTGSTSEWSDFLLRLSELASGSSHKIDISIAETPDYIAVMLSKTKTYKHNNTYIISLSLLMDFMDAIKSLIEFGAPAHNYIYIESINEELMLSCDEYN